MYTTLNAKVKTNTKQFDVKLKNDCLEISVKSKPEKGLANREILKELKRILKVDAEITSGLKSSNKRIRINAKKEEIMKKL